MNSVVVLKTKLKLNQFLIYLYNHEKLPSALSDYSPAARQL